VRLRRFAVIRDHALDNSRRSTFSALVLAIVLVAMLAAVALAVNAIANAIR
jgi:hypothetical protein